MAAQFFHDPKAFRNWFEKNHSKETELWVGFYKVGSGKPSITWPQSVDEALCFGWIDGIRKSIDQYSYMIRFTPRKPDSIWSVVNIKKIADLISRGLMQPEGLKAFEKRKESKSGTYSFEQEKVELDEAFTDQFKVCKNAWIYFQLQAPSYRKAAIWWVMSAKQEQTKQKRLQELIRDSEAGQYVKHLKRPGKP